MSSGGGSASGGGSTGGGSTGGGSTGGGSTGGGSTGGGSTGGGIQCTAESDAVFCNPNARVCGTFTALDNCGQSRTIGSCGSCTGNDSCNAGVCSCVSESSAQFCNRMSVTCGPTSGTDLCGNPKTIANCGSCTGPQTCGGGGMPGRCGCTPITNAEVCTLRGKNCNTANLTDIGCPHSGFEGQGAKIPNVRTRKKARMCGPYTKVPAMRKGLNEILN